MNEMTTIKGQEHWTTKDGGVKLFLFEKCQGDPAKSIGTILFVHGSSMASQPTFDLQVPGRPYSSVMDFFADQGFDSYSTLIETRRDLVEKNPGVVQRFVDASIIGWYNYLYGDNAAASQTLHDALKEIGESPGA